jgi:hypothetical protein
MLMLPATYSFFAKAARTSAHIVGVDGPTAREDDTLAERHAR